MDKDLLCLGDLCSEELHELLDSASRIKQSLKEKGNSQQLAGKTLAMVFQKPSLRTRTSFDVGMYQLGGYALYLSPDEIKLGYRESVPDAARVLSRYVDGIMARVFEHEDVVALAKWATVPVINGLSDRYHPCQGLADLLTVSEHMGRLSGVKLAYLGDGNNVVHSLMLGGALVGMSVTVATPEGYEPDATIVAAAAEAGARTGAEMRVVRDPRDAVRGADVIYTDTWTSMGQEAEAKERRAIFPPYQINDDIVALANDTVGVMHCLPAHRGEEITDEVADGPHSWLFDQAENRLHAQKAVLVKLIEG